jgi:hypothetical protein
MQLLYSLLSYSSFSFFFLICQAGFVAKNAADELSAGPAYECWITKAVEDISAQVGAVLEKEGDPLKRANAVRNKTQEIAAAAQEGRVGIRCDVKEMLPNQFMLFTFERLLDVRIVYVPPKSLGNFGGVSK